MKVLIAGATGAIGRPLISRLLAAGEPSLELPVLLKRLVHWRRLARKRSRPMRSIQPPSAMVIRVRPEAIVNEPTSLPQHDTPEAMKAATERDRPFECRATRICCPLPKLPVFGATFSNPQHFLPRPGLADENSSFAVETVALRYGFFYGPGTWFTKDNSSARCIERQS